MVVKIRRVSDAWLHKANCNVQLQPRAREPCEIRTHSKAYLQRHGQRSALAVIVDGRTGAEEEIGSGGGEGRSAAEGRVCGVSFWG